MKIKMLTAVQVRKQVKAMANAIPGQRSDGEVLHSIEDAIHANVLEAIAQGRCEDPKACAQEALKTRLLDFPRFCA